MMKNKILKLMILLSLLIPLLSEGCSSKKEEQETQEIEITDNSYKPQTLTISPNTEVTWKNTDTIPHTVTSGIFNHIKFDSGKIMPGEKFHFTFTVRGNYEVYCKLHNDHLHGSIIVN